MSKVETITCDRCGAEIPAFNNIQISENSARLDLYAIGQRRTSPSQRIDLCEECYNAFIQYLETL